VPLAVVPLTRGGNVVAGRTMRDDITPLERSHPRRSPAPAVPGERPQAFRLAGTAPVLCGIPLATARK